MSFISLHSGFSIHIFCLNLMQSFSLIIDSFSNLLPSWLITKPSKFLSFSPLIADFTIRSLMRFCSFRFRPMFAASAGVWPPMT
ncbi:hypothetical protein NTE_02414 [Candidatus Nitrososphaera evergladensis SR1]|uniref:Uncharacterized protein n=1 Tax=Candidatus Nitrososphaera evergladensis SR1 TaxID=1459636 RepID=A0A075MYX9_9ARCH|nr:hypothetical protein NTE_02414 [Candidatus Nitrososphaera evergladensis SR1]